MKYEALFNLVKSHHITLLDTRDYPATILIPTMGYAVPQHYRNGTTYVWRDIEAWQQEDFFDRGVAQLLADGAEHILFFSGEKRIEFEPALYSEDRNLIVGYALGSQRGWFVDVAKEKVVILQ